MRRCIREEGESGQAVNNRGTGEGLAGAVTMAVRPESPGSLIPALLSERGEKALDALHEPSPGRVLAVAGSFFFLNQFTKSFPLVPRG